MKTKKILAVTIGATLALSTALALTACGGNAANTGTDDGDKCTVTFDAGSGTIFGERIHRVQVDKNSTVAEPSENPVNGEQYFLGWNVTGSAQDEMWNFDADKVNNDITLYAVWARAFTVTFDADGGAFDNGADTYETTVADGAKLTAPQVTAPTDRVLKGWYNYYTEWNFDTDTVRQSITLTAKWDLSAELETALAPFEYIDSNGKITITGVNDNSVTTLKIPSAVTEIADAAFKNCDELVSVTVDDSVEAIGKSAFENCAKLKNVTLPSSLKRLESRLFSGCAQLETIEIPDTVNFIDASVFNGCAALKSVELPVGIDKIPNYLFEGCASLETVTVNAQITSIGANSFYGCAKLKNFDVSNATAIGFLAFYGCASLETVTVSSACATIGMQAFRNCTGLTEVSVNCATVDSSAFYGCSALTDVTIGSNVKTIKGSAFLNCTSLTEITIPDNVTELASAALSGCSALQTASLGSGVTAVSSSLFADCSALRTVEFKGTVTEIKERAFRNCLSLTQFTVPTSVTKVGANAFEDCVRLKELIKLNPDTTIASNAVESSCKIIASSAESQFKTVDDYLFYPMNSISTPYTLVDYVGSATALTLPDDCEGQAYSIHNYALAFDSSLKSVTFPSTVETIGTHVLYRSNNIETLAVASGNAKFMSQGNCIISIGNKTYNDRNKLVMGCKTSVIPTDGNVVDYIESYAFCGNTEIANLTIPSNITDIAYKAFEGCDKLIRTEGNIQYVDKWAISCSYSDAGATVEFADDTVGIAGDFCGYYASDSSNAMCFKIAAVVTNADLKYISRQAFYNCSILTSLTLNDGLISIGGSAFSSCKKLTEIVIPDSVTTLGSAAFMNCTSIEYVKFPTGATSIGYQFLDGCTGLKTIVIPSDITDIEHDAVKGCTSLTTVYYGGAAAAWTAVTKQSGNNLLSTATVVYYSETSQSGCWHYGADGKPTLWA